MGKILLRGFIGIAPIAITITLLFWIYERLESTFGSFLKEIIGTKYYFQGLGVITALIILFFIGLILNNWVVQKIYNYFEKVLKKIPLLKTIYSSVSDLMSFFQAGEKQEKGKVVCCEIGELKMIGVVTREVFEDLPKGIGSDKEVAVFIPFSYQVGGFTVIIPKSKIKLVDLSLERGLRFNITAGNPSADKPTYSINN
ncbi:MAG: DUF502 domain-containing protein [Chlamydiae bacterium]|nr:DUF502 domain-containing protein [Chlamydiota bacterium]